MILSRYIIYIALSLLLLSLLLVILIERYFAQFRSISLIPYRCVYVCKRAFHSQCKHINMWVFILYFRICKLSANILLNFLYIFNFRPYCIARLVVVALISWVELCFSWFQINVNPSWNAINDTNRMYVSIQKLYYVYLAETKE